MFLHKITIGPNASIASIVRQNHHTADVFRKYGIEYCCGGNWPLETICLNKDLPFEVLKTELEDACRVVQLFPSINFESWDTDFLVSYIINVHHQFLKSSIPDTVSIINNFVEGHKKKYPEMQEVSELFQQLQLQIIPHLQYEEETIFPYITQIAHAHDNKDSYAKLLVKTLRKPLDLVMKNENDSITTLLFKIRMLTNNYSIPEKSCVSHTLALSRLKDLDNDLMQHVYLENQILFPMALRIEAVLLK